MHAKVLEQIVAAKRENSRDDSRLQELVRRARELDGKIIDEFARAGVWTAADQDWSELLNERSSEAVSLVNTTITQRLNETETQFGLSPSEKTDLQHYYSSWTQEGLRDAIQGKGFEQLWRDYIFNNHRLQTQAAAVTGQCGILCIIIVHIAIELAVQAVHSECGNCNETLPPPDGSCTPNKPNQPSCT